MHLGQSISFTSMFSDIWFHIFLNWKQKLCFYYNYGDILLYHEMFCNLRYTFTMASFKHNHTFPKSGLQFNQTHFNASHYSKYIFNKVVQGKILSNYNSVTQFYASFFSLACKT